MALKHMAASYLGKLQESDYGISAVASGAVNYFLDSFFQKSDERARARPEVRMGPADPITHVKEQWLECDLHTCVTLNRTYPAVFRDLNAWAIAKLFSGPDAQYEVIPFLDTYEFKDMVKGAYAFRIQSEQMAVAPGRQATLPVYGCLFVRHTGTGAKLFVTIDLCHESMACVVTVMSRPDLQASVEGFFSDLQSSIAANDIYFRHCLSYVRGKLDFFSVTPTLWDSIILKDHIKSVIRQNTVGVLENMKALAGLGMCPNQNVILISPPGMAKTTIFRAVSGEVDGEITRIWCTGKSIDSSRDVTSLFEAARGLAPCIVIIEDMDLFGRDRSSGMYGSDPHVLNEFLACLDGAQENAGVVVMASTNDIDSMDEALVNRPGRFDVKVELPFPDAQDRSDMLKKFLIQYHSVVDSSVSQDTWSTLIHMTEGLTGAYVKLLAKSAVIAAASDGRTSPDGSSCVLSADHLNAAADHVMKNYRIGQRAKKHHSAKPETVAD
ncbi:MAG: ATP-dependent zinc metalloprotease FtsH 3 [Synergistetes bacterium ADurb.BinA166]|nr:MAG: ATP-dependent zinc metalloprotease FtsH 3 [Synergistetes bacterium ADurb.BinA166]